MRVNFIEYRDSRLLKSPLRMTGEYQRPDDDTFVRQVRVPYAETTTIHTGGAMQGQVTLERTGKAPRTFSLAQAPELAGLQASFGAMLAGDRTLLEQFYTITTQGSRGQWTMILQPRTGALAEQVRDITLHGRGVELRCIETRPLKGDIQRTLLSGAARAAGASMTPAAMAALCKGGA